MNKKYIWIVSIVLSISLFSLILLQGWFFQNARNLKKEQLDLTVNIALNNVTNELERMEREQRIQVYMEYSRRQQQILVPTGKYSGTKVFQSQSIFSSGGYSNSNLFNSDFLINTKPLNERIEFDKLEGIIAKALTNNNIFLNFEFAIKTGSTFNYMSDNYLQNAEKKKRYAKVLFPNETPSLSSKQSFLLIYFPSADDFFADAFKFVIPASILILILILSTAFTIYIIFRQKRVSNIKNDFINNMTHEFKTPISTISLASQMLKDNTFSNTPQTVERISNIISEESKRLSFQVETILQMAVSEDVEMKLKKKNINLNDLIEKHVPNFRINVEKQGGTILTHLATNLKNIEGDEVHIGNLISNLLDNALKYSHETPEITISTENKNGQILMSIADNGIGIAKKDQQMIFERFYRVHTGNLHNIKGFGLGLSYVKKVVDAHKGTIELESMLGKGSKFTIVLNAVE